MTADGEHDDEGPPARLRFVDRLCFWADPRRGRVTARDACRYAGDLKALMEHRHWIARNTAKRAALARKAPPVAFRTRAVRRRW